MKYVGSKNRHAKEILKAILSNLGYDYWYDAVEYRNWIEPFVGGANMIDKVPKTFPGKLIGSDINPYVICMFNAIQRGWIPPEHVTESEYARCRQQSKLPPKEQTEHYHLIGFVGIGCSYSGKWFGGYARGDDSNGIPRNYALESRNNLLAQAENIKDVFFQYGDYRHLTVPSEPSIIYCDPPYENTTKYRNSIEHQEFWNWCNQIPRMHKVFVSEYNAPEEWICIWSKTVNNSLTKNTGSKRGIEKLFTRR